MKSVFYIILILFFISCRRDQEVMYLKAQVTGLNPCSSDVTGITFLEPVSKVRVVTGVNTLQYNVFKIPPGYHTIDSVFYLQVRSVQSSDYGICNSMLQSTKFYNETITCINARLL